MESRGDAAGNISGRKAMILVIDNYDSFTYNLVQYLGEVSGGTSIEVKRNDAIRVQDIPALRPTHIVISPGPCTPNEAGISVEVVKEFSGKLPILGVCLGHQAIGQAFGGKIVRAKNIVHGKTTLISHDATGIFKNIDSTFAATRYHSLVIDPLFLPAVLRVNAWSPDNEIMGVLHREHESTIGVQFHPESILTIVGKQLLANFLKLSKRP